LDLLLLQAVVREAAERLVEQEVLRVSLLGPLRYLFRFSTPARDKLLVSLRPDLPRLHLLIRSRQWREEPPDPFAAVLDREIGGSVLAGLAQRPWDRVVEMRFRVHGRGPTAGVPAAPLEPVERRVIVELLGRSANILVLAADGTLLAHARDLRSAFRAPVAGTVYEPPPGREGYRGLPEGPAALPAIRARFGDARAFLTPLSPLFAREAGQDPGVLERILRAQSEPSWAPVVYASRAIGRDEGGEDAGPGPGDGARDEPVAAPLPLLSLAGRVATPFRSPSEAAEVAYGLIERQRAFLQRRAHHAALIRREIGRLQTLIRNLERDREVAAACDRHRRHGEAILAGLPAARLEGDRIVVPDPYDPSGSPLRIPIDPSRTLPDNARALFARSKKGRRGLALIETRLAAARSRLREWQDLAAPASRPCTAEDLDRLCAALARLGIVHAAPPTGRRRRGAESGPPARVRRHTSPDGMEILVGRSGDENDTLTFRVAAPHDFWLHAAGRPGAHVVVRNPQRLRAIPEATLRVAAAIAAFYSDARREGKVEVHYTQRKHVRKGKRMPRGQVLVRRFRTIQVAPRLPGTPAGEVT
jgi:predicted ribosome quality control (RQC) complex YloA/Tae2 family protein